MHGQAIWVFEPLDHRGLLDLLSRLDTMGLRRLDPTTRQFRAWGTTEADAGEVRVTTPEDLIQAFLLGGQDEVAFQLWSGPGDATLVSLGYVGESPALTFRFDGLTPDEAQGLSATVLWAVLNTDASIALMVDPGLPDTWPEWEEFLDRKGPVPQTAALVWTAPSRKQTQFVEARPAAWAIPLIDI